MYRIPILFCISSSLRGRILSSSIRGQGRRITRIRPIFVEALPAFGEIRDGELWISHKRRAMNLRCPCGCGDLTVLSIIPSRWHVYFDGKTVSLKGPTGGSIWTSAACGSHYFIRNNEVVWSHSIDPSLRAAYEEDERARMTGAPLSRSTRRSRAGRIWLGLWTRVRRK